jgi:dienelactone hydrolase
MRESILNGFDRYASSHDGIEHVVYRIGNGTPVLVMHELPGLSQAAIKFARRLADSGFQVHLPHLFGPLGRSQAIRNSMRLCISREFGFLRSGKATPITQWLRALANEISAETGHERIGAIGMCLTGAFVIPLVLERSVVAPVASQPAMPISFVRLLTGVGGRSAAQRFNVSEEEVEAAAERMKRDDVKLLAFRFEEDRISPQARFDRLAAELGNQFEPHVYGGGSAFQRWVCGRHSVLTEDSAKPGSTTHQQTEQAFATLLAFLRSNLKAG